MVVIEAFSVYSRYVSSLSSGQNLGVEDPPNDVCVHSLEGMNGFIWTGAEISSDGRYVVVRIVGSGCIR
jgi:hypothetical protein